MFSSKSISWYPGKRKQRDQAAYIVISQPGSRLSFFFFVGSFLPFRFLRLLGYIGIALRLSFEGREAERGFVGDRVAVVLQEWQEFIVDDILDAFQAGFCEFVQDTFVYFC